jgi:hypothetical protein
MHVTPLSRLKQLTNSIEMNPYYETTSRSATEEFPNMLKYPSVHYRVYKSPPLIRVLNPINRVCFKNTKTVIGKSRTYKISLTSVTGGNMFVVCGVRY